MIENIPRLLIRRADERDIPSIVLFLDSYLSKDFFMTAGVIRRCVTGDNPDGGTRTPYFVWLAFEEEGDILVGVCIVSTSLTLENLVVHPTRRGKGIGKALLLKAFPLEIRAKTDMSSGNPIEFYEKCGYRVIEIADPKFRYMLKSKGKHNIALMRRTARENEQMHFGELGI